MKPFRKSKPAYSEEDAIYSISGVDNADLDLNRLGEVIEMDESEIRSQYQKWTNEIAQRNLNFLKEKTAHEQYRMDAEIDVWHICTQKFTYPALKRMLDESTFPTAYSHGVDLGCGTVTFFDWIKVENPVLVDLSKDYCDFMASKGWEVLNENVENLSLESGSQNVVVCSDILEHVLSSDSAIEEVKRILAPEGILLVNVPWKQELSEIPALLESHIRTFNEDNLQDKFAGWNVVAKEVIGPPTKPNGIQTINLLLTQSIAG